MLAQVGDKGQEALQVVQLHLSFKGIQAFYQYLTLALQLTAPPHIEDLIQCLALDLVLQTRMLRMIQAALAAPEHGVLCLCVDHHTIEVEQGCFQFFFLHTRLQRYAFLFTSRHFLRNKEPKAQAINNN